ncbi:MAG: alpha/beta hydrolase [Saprospiraceae bacterium]
MKNTNLFLLLCSLFFLFQVSVQGQVSDYGSRTKIHKLTSEQQHDYKLRVTLPNNYDSTQTYKVLYYLDSWWLSEIVLGTHALLHITDLIDGVILVGIGLEGTGYDWNVQRNRDFTPTPYDIKKMRINFKTGRKENAAAVNAETTGGADAFLLFLETKVIKLIAQHYPNTKEERGFLGHSFGGLFGIYALQENPGLFSELIIISGALWWNKQEILTLEHFAKIKDKKTKLFICYGGTESRLITKSNLKINEILAPIKSEAFQYEFTRYETANHNSILPQAIYDGLLFLYGKK